MVVFILPFLALWTLFRLGPVLYGIVISLSHWDPFGSTVFVGGLNYLRLLRDSRFWEALGNTFEFAILVVPLIVSLGLVFALLVHGAQHMRWARVVEAALFFPYLLTVSIVGLVWRWLFDPDFGIVLITAKQLGLRLPVFLNEPRWAIPAIAFATTWWLVGYRMVLFRAALEDIPVELYEAAQIDGARWYTMIFAITLPLLRPAILFAVVLTTISGFTAFGQVLIMTQGGPGRASEVLALYMYRIGFDYLEMGQAAAVGVVLFVVMLALTLLAFRWLGYGTEL